MNSSIISYPNRGPWGQSAYRGNCSGFVQKSLIDFFKPSYFVDPAEGGGTSRDVCRQMGIKYTGLDLRTGFNLLKDKLKDRLEGNPDFIFFHPPYGEMVQYSGNLWGTPHNDDLSRCGNSDIFLSKLELALMNIYDPLKQGGHYAVLIGDMRKNGEYISWQSDIIGLGLGKLKNVLIKAQHNCLSNSTTYSGSFIPIQHEYLLIFMKDRQIISFGQLLMQKDERVARRAAGTWKQIISQIVQELGGTATIEQTTDIILQRINPEGNQHVSAKVRQVLQDPIFHRVSEGQYSLN